MCTGGPAAMQTPSTHTHNLHSDVLETRCIDAASSYVLVSFVCLIVIVRVPVDPAASAAD